MSRIRKLGEDIVLWMALAVFCAALLIDYVTGSRLSEWLI